LAGFVGAGGKKRERGKKVAHTRSGKVRTVHPQNWPGPGKTNSDLAPEAGQKGEGEIL